MLSPVLLICFAFIVFDASAHVRPVICGEENLYATNDERLFKFVLGEEDTIPVNTECKWTITQVMGEEEPARSILIYLKPTSESDPDQCVQLRVPPAESEHVICAELGVNVFEFSGQNIAMLFPGRKICQKLKPFTVYYKLGNSKNSNCGPTLLTAEDPLKYIQVPIASNCSWLLWANKNEPINIYMKKRETPQEGNHCVNVIHNGGQYSDNICTINGDILTPEKQPVEITYTSSESVPNNNGTFRVYYRMRNCGQYHLAASTEEQTFPIYAVAADIPERHTCFWIIQPNNKKPFEIKVERSQVPNQCVKVFCAKNDIICADSSENMVECSEQLARVTFPVSGYSRTVKNFRVIYKSVEEESSGAQKCENIQLVAGFEKHKFNVVNASETVPQGHNCTWSINDSTNNPIRISLETVGADNEKQCVTVSCSVDQVSKEICASAGNNSFTCTTKPVIVMYRAKSSVGDVRNFQVTYQIDSAKTKPSHILSLSFIILFIQRD